MAFDLPTLPVDDVDLIFQELAEKIQALPEAYRPPLQASMEQLMRHLEGRRADRRIEQALRESETRFLALANSAPLPIFMTDTSGENIFVNRAYREFLSITAPEAEGMLWQRFLHPEDGPAYIEQFLCAVREQKPFKGEVRARRDHGDWHWMVVYAEPYYSASGAYLGHVGSSLDITESKHAEQALRESQQMFQAIFRSAPFPTVLLNATDSTVVDINHAFLDLFGFTREEVIGKTATELGVVPDPQARAEIIEEILQKGFVRGRELSYHTRAGEKLVVSMNSDRIQIGEKWFLLTAVENITERKRAESALKRYTQLLKERHEALRESEARERARANELAALMDAVPAMIWVTHDPECREMISNRAGNELLLESAGANVSSSAPADVLARQKYHNMKDGVPIPISELPMQVAAATGQPARNYTYDVVFDDGATYHLIGNVNPLFDGEGRPAGAVGAFVDITALRRLEAERLEAKTEIEVQRRLMEQREQERQQIARDIHDGPIQNLVSTLFNLQVIKEAQKDRKLQVELNQLSLSIKNSVQELRQVVNELRPPSILLLGFSRAIQIHAEDFREKHPELELHLHLPDDHRRFADQTSLTLFRIYQEALNNIVRHAEATRVDVHLLFQGDQVTLSIQDNGKGFTVTPDLVAQTEKGHYGMAGMKERAEALDGRLEFKSRPGKGTTIRLIFPLDQGE